MAEDRNPSRIEKTEEMGRASEEDVTPVSNDDEFEDTEDLDEEAEEDTSGR